MAVLRFLEIWLGESQTSIEDVRILSEHIHILENEGSSGRTIGICHIAPNERPYVVLDCNYRVTWDPRQSLWTVERYIFSDSTTITNELITINEREN